MVCARKRKFEEDERQSIPNVLQGEVARLDPKFLVNLDPSHCSNNGTVHLICKLGEYLRVTGLGTVSSALQPQCPAWARQGVRGAKLPGHASEPAQPRTALQSDVRSASHRQAHPVLLPSEACPRCPPQPSHTWPRTCTKSRPGAHALSPLPCAREAPPSHPAVALLA